MSFVYAEKYYDNSLERESTRIFCDTRVSLGNFSGAHFSSQSKPIIEQWGIIKSTICNPNLCVSFAGNNIGCAAQLFRQLADAPFEYKDVVNYALEIHQRADQLDDCEFLITYYNEGRFHIDCVKNGSAYTNRDFDWIGSEEAHKAFQRYRLTHTKKDEHVTKYSSSAFGDVVSGCKDDSVGGFPIEVRYRFDKESFSYCNSSVFTTSKPQLLLPGESLKFPELAQDGGFSYETTGDSIYTLLIRINQLDYILCYSRSIRSELFPANNPNLFGLMLPMRVRMNQESQAFNID